MNNIPEIRLGLVAMSRDCFPRELSRSRRQKVAQACRKLKIPVTEIETVVEGENSNQVRVVLKRPLSSDTRRRRSWPA